MSSRAIWIAGIYIAVIAVQSFDDFQNYHPPAEANYNLPKSPTSAQKINIDNKTCFDYLGEWVSIAGV
jgi:hypothetical protein